MSVEVPGVGLAEAIELVRSELQKAADAGSASPIAFRPQQVELDFELVFGRTGGADAGVRVWVVSLGGKAESSASRSQRLKITLSTVDRTTDQSPLISDEGAH